MISSILVLVGIILIIFSAVCEAIMDKLQFHYDISIFKNLQGQQFWNPSISWKNKYDMETMKPKFFGSTTIFVFLTDAWHLFKFLRTLLLFLGLIIIGFNSMTLIIVILLTIIARLIFGMIFQYFFKNIF